MLQRQLLQPLLQPNVWQGAVAASATAGSQLITGLSAVGNGSLSLAAQSGINWRGLAADATTADAEAVPWSSGVAGSSTTSSNSQQRQVRMLSVQLQTNFSISLSRHVQGL